MDWIVRRGLVKIPDDVPFEQAAFIEPVNTCYKAIDLLGLQPDETVLVIGQGPIGILLAALGGCLVTLYKPNPPAPKAKPAAIASAATTAPASPRAPQH